MARPMRVSNDTREDYKEYYIDSAAELSEIDTEKCCAGSIAFIINEGIVYMLSETKEWKEI